MLFGNIWEHLPWVEVDGCHIAVDKSILTQYVQCTERGKKGDLETDESKICAFVNDRNKSRFVSEDIDPEDGGMTQ